MRKILFFIIVIIIIISCNSVNQAEKNLYSGNYTQAISSAVSRLQKNKQKDKDFKFVSILEQAYSKMVQNSTSRIEFLKKDSYGNKKEIYNHYLTLDKIQDQIKPLLPLKKQDGTLAQFTIIDYSDAILEAKTEYVESLYASALFLLNGDKYENRKAYTVFSEILNIYPNYKNVKVLRDEAKFKGTDFVYMIIENNTKIIIPRDLENALLDFNTYGLDDFWTEYHSSKERNLSYDYEVVLEFKNILISPERISEKQIPLEKEIIEVGYRKDRNGKYILDANGNRIREERKQVVKGVLTEVIQFKNLSLAGQVHYFDLNRNQRINTYPLQTEFVFENIFGTLKGDARVLDANDQLLIRNKFVIFPSNEQMLFDASNDIKTRLGEILKKYKFN